MKYWQDCADQADILALWSQPDVKREWLAAGEDPRRKVFLSRSPDGQVYLTQTEMLAVVDIIISRYFKRKLDPGMICAIIEIESERQPLAHRYDIKAKEAKTGLMLVAQSTAEWLRDELGFNAYSFDWATTMLYRPFVGVYFGAAYLRWLSTYEKKRRSEEFIVRAYHSGPEHALSRSSAQYWAKYLLARQNLPFTKDLPQIESPVIGSPSPLHPNLTEQRSPSPGHQWIYWEERASTEDMAEMWRQLDVKKEWTKSGEKHGKVRFSRDEKARARLTRTELKAVANIIVSRYFSERGVNPTMLCTLAEISSNRLVFVNDGLMQTSHAIAQLLYTDLGFKSYRLRSSEDLTKPFVSVYFAAAYVSWLSNYKGRSRSDQFIVQAYRCGPQSIEAAEAGPFWLRYLDVYPEYVNKPKTSARQCCVVQ